MLKKRRRVEESGDHFWPGYVDALTNVVINLLFLLAIFLLTVFVVSTFKSKNKSEAVFGVIAKTIDVSATKAVAGTGIPKIQAEKDKGEGGIRLYKIMMPANAEIESLTLNLLNGSLSNELIKQAIKIEVWGDSHEEPSDIRRSYFVIQRIKNLLEEGGAKEITTRIYPLSSNERGLGGAKSYFVKLKLERY